MGCVKLSSGISHEQSGRRRFTQLLSSSSHVHPCLLLLEYTQEVGKVGALIAFNCLIHSSLLKRDT